MQHKLRSIRLAIGSDVFVSLAWCKSCDISSLNSFLFSTKEALFEVQILDIIVDFHCIYSPKVCKPRCPSPFTGFSVKTFHPLYIQFWSQVSENLMSEPADVPEQFVVETTLENLPVNLFVKNVSKNRKFEISSSIASLSAFLVYCEIAIWNISSIAILFSIAYLFVTCIGALIPFEKSAYSFSNSKKIQKFSLFLNLRALDSPERNIPPPPDIRESHYGC